MLCNFLRLQDNWFRCVNCNLELRSPDGKPPIFPCKHSTVKKPNDTKKTFAEKVKNFAKASADHLSSGMKIASDEVISERYSICKNCEFFNNDTCSQCGCPIYQHKKYISKLAWAEQKCPVDKW